jgi:uracil-DNA glycosylase
MTREEIKETLLTFPNGWDKILNDEKNKLYYQSLVDEVSKKYISEKVFPPVEKVFNAFTLTSLDDVKVVIVGQDPYHEEGQANGLAFSVNTGVALPKSLQNIYKELFYEFGYPIPKNGSLESWAKQGVLLLNDSLTVKEGEAASHSNLGWQTFTNNVIKALNQLDRPIVYLLWGNFANKKAELITNPKACVIHTAHPSPLSASRGFFCSSCFKRVNQFLKDNYLEPINWQITD